MNRSYFGLSSALFPAPLPADWEESRKAGFRAAELSVSSHGPCICPEDCFRIGGKVATDIQEAGLLLWTVHIPYGPQWDPSVADQAERMENCGRIRAVLEESARWGAKGAVLHGSYEPVPLDAAQREIRLECARESTAFLAEKAERMGLFLAIEDLPRSCLGNCSGELREILGSSGASVCFDVNHLLMESHADFLSSLGSQVQTLHLSDYDFQDECHWLPGDGKINWVSLMDDLESTGYDGPLLFEISHRRLTGVRPADVLEKFHQAVSRGTHF